LFSGIGGLDLAAEWAGFRTIAQVERSDYCRRVLAKHWPGVHRCADIKDFPDADLGPVDLVSGGFPCQPFSVAGKRGGTQDDRHLWPQMLRVVRALAPAWVVAENVPGLLSIEQGMVFERVCTDLEAAGYEVVPLLVPACSVGAWHRRNRIFIVAHNENKRCERGGVNGRNKEGKATSGDSPEAGDVPDVAIEGLPIREGRSSDAGSAMYGAARGADWWAAEPDVVRVVHGFPGRVDRVRALGNAVVPQQAYPIFKAIAETWRTYDR
jgi:DNA (cytosine-5)-methyltransferase 1